MKTKNIDTLLADAPFDPGAGIRLVRAAGRGAAAVFAAQIEAYVTLRAHYHMHGDEIYLILEGDGIMHLTLRGEGGKNVSNSFPVTRGDTFTVPAGTVHSLENSSGEMMRALFVCDETHVSTDRFFMQEDQ